MSSEPQGDRTVPDREPGEDASPSAVTRVLPAVGGAAAAATALATGEVISELVDDAPSPVIAVADLLVSETPGGIVSWSIETIGAAQQTLLIWGVVVVSLAVGAFLGLVALRRVEIAVAGFVAFGAIGGWAAARSPDQEWFPAWATALVAAAVGIAVLLGTSGHLRPRPASAAQDVDRPRETADRRREFLKVAGGATAWAIVGPIIGRAIGPDGAGDASRQDVAGDLGLDEDPDDGLDDQLGDPAPTVMEGETLDEIEGISDYLTPNPDFYVIDTALRSPQVDPDGWQLRIHGDGRHGEDALLR